MKKLGKILLWMVITLVVLVDRGYQLHHRMAAIHRSPRKAAHFPPVRTNSATSGTRPLSFHRFHRMHGLPFNA